MTRNLQAILCILVLLFAAAAPATAGDTTVETSTFLSVTSPEQYDTIWSDLVPPEATVVGRAGASNGIRDVVVESSAGMVSCGNGTEFACSVPVAEGNETITVTLIDNLGKTSDAVLHVYVNVDTPPPPWIYVIGTVRDADGRPVPGATVRFESVLPLSSGPHPVTAETADDGGYLIENAFGYGQTVSVEKDGYLPLHREVAFEGTVNHLYLELEPEPPQARTAPGFSAWAGILALSGGLLAVRAGRRREG
ncbi:MULTISPECIES: carboxypeptidase-like regulatory domain-containing protein [unclassified Methanoculleus]|uniref:carboxypeptidase-like regulatory domain-containing protein n=1 Tax=unclassified Methanoculleus TaxID=2619537 RepID=UPI0025E51090|nr:MULTISPECIES: carboxypeptidase-like regulatory domain-containing protein [unclassified Methanoculleus]